MTFAAVTVLLISTFFLSRIGYSADVPLPLALAVTPLVIGWLIVSGQAQLSMGRLALFMGVVACAMMSLFFSGPLASLMSVQLFIFIYAMFLAPIPLDRANYMRYFRLLANVASIFCILGAVQYLTQFLFLTDFHFSWRTIIPAEFLVEYNTLNETYWGSGVYKGNGFFLLEASHLSQVGSRALLIAIFILKEPKYIIPIGLGLITSYSGTGMLLLVIFGVLPFLGLVFGDRRYAPLAVVGLLMGVAVALMFWDKLGLDQMLSRVGEFSDPRSSGFARFTAGGLMFENFMKGNPVALLFGNGPGMAAEAQKLDGVTEAFSSAWIKLIVEYGIIGFVTFSAFIAYCFYTTTRSIWLTAAFLFQFMVLDGGLLVPQLAFGALMLGCLVRLKDDAAPGPQAGVRTSATAA